MSYNFSVGELVDAALLNTHLRDVLDDTTVAQAAAAGDIFYETLTGVDNLALGSAPALLARNDAHSSDAPFWANVEYENGSSLTFTTTSTSFVSSGLGGTGSGSLPSVTVNDVNDLLLVIHGNRYMHTNNAASGQAFQSFALSGDTTLAANQSNSIYNKRAVNSFYNGTMHIAMVDASGDVTVTLAMRSNSASYTATLSRPWVLGIGF